MTRRYVLTAATVACATAVVVSPPSSDAATRHYQLIGAGHMYAPTAVVSGNGRYVVFATAAPSAADQTNAATAGRLYRYDRVTKQQTLITTESPAGSVGSTPYPMSPSISDDGRYVAFISTATNLVPGDLNGAPDAFVWDAITHRIRRVSLDAHGRELPHGAPSVKISGDGTTVAFTTPDPIAMPTLGNGGPNLYLAHWAQPSTVRLVAVPSTVSYDPAAAGVADTGDDFAISRSGQFVAFAFTGQLTHDDAEDPGNGPPSGPDAQNLYLRDMHAAHPVLLQGAPPTNATCTAGSASHSACHNYYQQVAISESGARVAFAVNVSGGANSYSNYFVNVISFPSRVLTSIDAPPTGVEQLPSVGQETELDTQVAISGNGRYVAFVRTKQSASDPTAPPAAGGTIYRRDLNQAGVTDRISPTSPGPCAAVTCLAGNSVAPSLSTDGGVVAFASSTPANSGDPGQQSPTDTAPYVSW